VFSQERFFNLYPGWVGLNIKYCEDFILISGLDTIDAGYSSSPIFITIDLQGDLQNTYRYNNDTVDGITIYSSQSYSWNVDQIVISGVYMNYVKDYVLYPILLYLDKNSLSIDSIKNFKSYLEDRAARFMLQYELNGKIYLTGDVRYAMDANVRTFFGIYDPVADTFSYKDYERPNYCKMTPYQILPTSDGGFLLATEQDMTYMTPRKVYSCILKIDSVGNEQWRVIIPGHTVVTPYGDIESANYRSRIFNAPDGNYYVVWTDPEAITPTYLTNNPEQTIRIAKLKDYGTYGELTEEKDLRSELDNFERAPYIINDAFQDEDGTMYILMQSDGGYQSALAKIHPNGVGAWMRVYICYPDDDASISSTKLYGISKTDDGGFMLTGAFNSTSSTLFPSGMIASCVFKTDSCGCFDAEGCNSHCADSYAEYFVTMPEASIFPNPASNKISVSFDYSGAVTEFTYKIYNLNGQLLMEGKSEKVTKTFDVEVDDLPSGYYMIQFWGGGKIFTGKFVKE